MNKLINNTVLNVIVHSTLSEGVYRVLWVDPERRYVVVIKIDWKNLKAPKWVGFTELLNGISANEIVITDLKLDPNAYLTDDELSKKYPAKKRTKQQKLTGKGALRNYKRDKIINVSTEAQQADEFTTQCYPIHYRDYWFAVIEPIVKQAEKYFKREVTLGSMIQERAKELGHSRDELYKAIYRYFAAGSAKSGLLPNTSRNGGKGVKRVGRGISLGRKNLKTELDRTDAQPNYGLTEVDIDRLQSGWRHYYKGSTSRYEAYIQTMNSFYLIRWEIRDGKKIPILKPKHKRPSINQFKTHGPAGDPELSAFRQRIDEKEWLFKHRALTGEKTYSFMVGKNGHADSSSNDVHLVSFFNSLERVGWAKTIFVVDEAFDLIVGFHVCWTIDSDAARLALLNSVTDKNDLCRRYGVNNPDNAIPAYLINNNTFDRGEFHCEAIRIDLENIKVSAVYVKTGRPDLRSQGETPHHTFHSLVSKHLPGATHGQPKERGKRDPALDACMNIHEYIADLIRAIIHWNSKAIVPLEKIPTEMRRDNVKPTRIEMYRWAEANGYVAYRKHDPLLLVRVLWPEIEAVVLKTGVYFIYYRNGTRIRIKRLRYMGEIAERRRWLELARQKAISIKVRYNPNDLEKIYYIDPDFGPQELHLKTSDPLLKNASFEDVKQDEVLLKLDAEEYEEEALQDRAEMSAIRKGNVANAKRRQATAEKRSGKAKPKSQKAANRRQNQKNEVAKTGKSPQAMVESSVEEMLDQDNYESMLEQELIPGITIESPSEGKDQSDDMDQHASRFDKWISSRRGK